MSFLFKRFIVKTNFLLRQSLKNKKRSFGLFFWLISGLVAFLYLFLLWNNDPLAIETPYIYIEPINSYYRFKHSHETKDWHDYQTIEDEAKREGPGEQGGGIELTKDEEELGRQIFQENKHNGLASDKIARDRSLPDTRPEECQKKEYLKELPTVSVVIPFHNEILSTLTRTIHSVFNRSPPELLKEVILVNDHSDKEYCYGPLEEYIRNHFDLRKIRILVMPYRSGLMWARLAGARAASGDVLVFMDCHTEANVNWLPPLIEPIALDYKVCVCPFIDVISASDYAYRATESGTRGVFDWNFYYQFLPLRPEDKALSPAEPIETPVMMGCVFAISAKFFWEIGGYDSGLDIWGGEQYELSFKVWLCGSGQLDAPCSRVGHLYRPRPFTNVRNGSDYYSKNYKRVVETWMDEYKEYVYNRNPERWLNVDHGDVSYMKGIREKLQCKPFSYFLEVVAPDMLDRYPLVDPPTFTYGAIQSLADEKLCIDTLGAGREEPIGLYPCKSPLENPGFHQTFKLRIHRDIYIEHSGSECLDFNHGKILVFTCKFKQDNQYFRYDLKTQQIVCGSMKDNRCIDSDTRLRTLWYAPCDVKKLTQKWKWAVVNETMLNNWASFGKPILDPQERRDFGLDD